MDRPVYASDESLMLYQSVQRRLDALEKAASDCSQRWDTEQTPWFRRVWFWIDGWPWYDRNGAQRRRPWHRDR